MALDTSYILSSGTTTATTSGKTSETKGKQDLDMNDFMMLMVEQMKNQDIGSTMDTSQYINQLSQFTMIQAVTEMASAVKNGFSSLQEMSLSTYSTSMIGKDATIAIEDASGNLESITGKIEGVTFYEGSPMVIVNGQQYELSKVMGLSESSSDAATKLAEAAIAAADAATKAATEATDAAKSGAEAAEAIRDLVENTDEDEDEEAIGEVSTDEDSSEE